MSAVPFLCAVVVFLTLLSVVRITLLTRDERVIADDHESLSQLELVLWYGWLTCASTALGVLPLLLLRSVALRRAAARTHAVSGSTSSPDAVAAGPPSSPAALDASPRRRAAAHSAAAGAAVAARARRSSGGAYPSYAGHVRRAQTAAAAEVPSKRAHSLPRGRGAATESARRERGGGGGGGGDTIGGGGGGTRIAGGAASQLAESPALLSEHAGSGAGGGAEGAASAAGDARIVLLRGADDASLSPRCDAALPTRLVAYSNAVAGGMMLAASAALAAEGSFFDHGVAGAEGLLPPVFAVAAGGAAGVLFVFSAGRWLDGVANLGVRPTVDAAGRTSLEVHLLDFAGDVYGQTLRVGFVEKLRGEKRFDSLDALVTQIGADVAAARRVLA